MDTMYIIKSGDLRYHKGGGSNGGRAGFSGRVSLKTAYKAGKRETAERLIAENVERCTAGVRSMEQTKPDTGPDAWYTAERIEQYLEGYRRELALWQAARIAEARLTEV